jgi:hypothetical protein
MNVWISLRYDREIAVELCMQAAKRNILAKAAIFESGATEVMGLNLSISVLRHEDDGVQDPRDGCRRQDRRPNEAVGSRKMVEKDCRPAGLV